VCTVHSSDGIGRQGQCFWMVLCAESRCIGGGVGGVRVWSENGWVWSRSALSRAWSRWFGGLRRWARVARRRGHGAVHGRA
jgi:hypothetical protein